MEFEVSEGYTLHDIVSVKLYNTKEEAIDIYKVDTYTIKEFVK